MRLRFTRPAPLPVPGGRRPGCENHDPSPAYRDPVSSTFRDRLEDEVPTWVEEGLVEEEQARRILDRYADEAEPGSEGADVQAWLYASAAVLIGAAALAFVFVGIDPPEPGYWQLAFGLGLAIAGAGLHTAQPERDLLVDALLAAGMVPLSTAAIDTEIGLVALVALALPIAILTWRWRQPFAPTLATIGFTVAAAGAAFSQGAWWPATDADKAATWFLGQGLFGAALVGYERWRGAAWRGPTSLAVIGLGISFIPFLLETTDLGSVEVELLLGGLLLLVLAIGSLLHHRGLVLGASVGLGIDAIVFAFDVDELFGTLVLLVLAGLAIWRAETLRGWLEPSR